jgi:hypothetical protein
MCFVRLVIYFILLIELMKFKIKWICEVLDRTKDFLFEEGIYIYIDYMQFGLLSFITLYVYRLYAIWVVKVLFLIYIYVYRLCAIGLGKVLL